MSEYAEWGQKLETHSFLLAQCLNHISLERRIFVSRIGNRRPVLLRQTCRSSSAFRRESSLERLHSADEIKCRRVSTEPRCDLACQVFAYTVEILSSIHAVGTVHD